VPVAKLGGDCWWIAEDPIPAWYCVILRVCIHIYIYICINNYVYIYMYVCVYSIYTSVCVCARVMMHIKTFKCICT
jgi:hypothetical protein